MKIDVTNGAAVFVSGTITERAGQSMATSTVEVGIGGYDDPPTSWVPPTDIAVAGAVTTVKLMVDSLSQVGLKGYLWARVEDATETHLLAFNAETVEDYVEVV